MPTREVQNVRTLTFSVPHYTEAHLNEKRASVAVAASSTATIYASIPAASACARNGIVPAFNAWTSSASRYCQSLLVASSTSTTTVSTKTSVTSIYTTISSTITSTTSTTLPVTTKTVTSSTQLTSTVSSVVSRSTVTKYLAARDATLDSITYGKPPSDVREACLCFLKPSDIPTSVVGKTFTTYQTVPVTARTTIVVGTTNVKDGMLVMTTKTLAGYSMKTVQVTETVTITLKSTSTTSVASTLASTSKLSSLSQSVSTKASSASVSSALSFVSSTTISSARVSSNSASTSFTSFTSTSTSTSTSSTVTYPSPSLAVDDSNILNFDLYLDSQYGTLNSNAANFLSTIMPGADVSGVVTRRSLERRGLLKSIAKAVTSTVKQAVVQVVKSPTKALAKVVTAVVNAPKKIAQTFVKVATTVVKTAIQVAKALLQGIDSDLNIRIPRTGYISTQDEALPLDGLTGALLFKATIKETDKSTGKPMDPPTQVKVYCVACVFSTKFKLGGKISLSVTKGFTGVTATLRGPMQLDFNIAVVVSRGVEYTKEKTIISVPLIGVTLGEVGAIGLYMDLSAGAGLSLQTSSTFLQNMTINWNDFRGDLDLLSIKNSRVSGLLPSKITPGFQVQGDVTVSAEFFLVASLNIGVTALGKKYEAKVSLNDKPSLELSASRKVGFTFKPDEGFAQIDCNGGIELGVQLKNDVYISAAAIKGFQWNLMHIEKPLWQTCIGSALPSPSTSATVTSATVPASSSVKSTSVPATTTFAASTTPTSTATSTTTSSPAATTATTCANLAQISNIFSPSTGGAFTLACGQDYGGWDIKNDKSISSFRACVEACPSVSGCVGVSYVSNVDDGSYGCWFKYSMDQGATSDVGRVDSAVLNV